MTFNDGSYYDGDFANGKMEGYGVRTYKNGDHVQG